MKPVTDPALLSQLNRPVTDPALLAQLNGENVAAEPPAPINLAEGMNAGQRMDVGIGAGMANIGRGALSLLNRGGLLPQALKKTLAEMEENRALYKKHSGDLGGWGTTGEVIGEGVATLPIGGVVGLGGKALSKAVPVLSKVAPAGGWRALAARGAAEGAAANVLSGESDKPLGELAQHGATVGAVLNPVLTKAITGTGRVLAKGATALSPTTKAAERRAIDAIERTLGADEFARAVDQVENPLPSQLPRTTAAMAQSPRMGALERGARARGTADFKSHDMEVDRVAWEALKNATPGADTVKFSEALPPTIMEQTQEALDKIAMSDKLRSKAGQKLIDLRTDQAVIASDVARKHVNDIMSILDNPDATLGALFHARTNVSSAAPFPGQSQIKNVLDDIVDSRTKGQLSDTLERYGHSKEALKAAQAAQRLRQAFDVEGVPKTAQYQGHSGVDAVPSMSSQPLRRALAQEVAQDAGDVKYMDPETVRKLNELADQLRAREIYKPSEGGGAATMDMGSAEGVASTALNAGPLWRMRGILGSAFKGLDDKTQAAADRALLNPDEFLRLVESKRARGEALAKWESALEVALRGISRCNSIEE